MATIVDKLRLYEEDSESYPLSAREKKSRTIIMFIISKKLNEPLIADKHIYNDWKTSTNEKLSFPQFWRMVQHAEEFMGLIKPASKLYMRFFITEQAKAGLERLKDEKSVKAEQARAKYLDILGKYNLVDQEDIERIPFEDILPISMEFTDDAKVAGFSPLSHAERINMRKKWRKKAGLDTIEDVEFEDIDDAEN